MDKERPRYALLFRLWKDRSRLSSPEIARRSQRSEAYVNKVLSGELIPTPDGIRRLTQAVSASGRETEDMLAAASEEYAARRPEQAERQDRWLRFQIVRAHGTDQWKDFEEEFQYILTQCNAAMLENRAYRKKGLPLRGEELIGAWRSELIREYTRIITDQKITASEDLAHALIDATGINQNELAVLAEWHESYVSHMLHPKDDGRFTSHSPSWGEFADALGLTELDPELKDMFLKRIVQLKAGPGATPLTLDEACARLQAEPRKEPATAQHAAPATPHVSLIIKTLCDDRIGDGKPFPTMRQLETRANVAMGVVNKNANRGLIAKPRTIRALADAIQLGEGDTARLLQMVQEQEKLQPRSGRDTEGNAIS